MYERNVYMLKCQLGIKLNCIYKLITSVHLLSDCVHLQINLFNHKLIYVHALEHDI